MGGKHYEFNFAGNYTTAPFWPASRRHGNMVVDSSGNVYLFGGRLYNNQMARDFCAYLSLNLFRDWLIVYAA